MNDARILHLTQVLASHAAVFGERDAVTREASVALLIRPRTELELLLIKRAIHERDPWSGHMALPGGRRDANDVDLIATALREVQEEVGIVVDRERDFIGALDEVAPRTPRLPPISIAPFIFAVRADVITVIHTAEVETAVWVPLSALRDEKAASEILIKLEGDERSFPSLQFGEYVIWGLTHRILTQFLQLTATL